MNSHTLQCLGCGSRFFSGSPVSPAFHAHSEECSSVDRMIRRWRFYSPDETDLGGTGDYDHSYI